MQKQAIYEQKDQGYFQGSRPDVVRLIPDGPNKILELGCGEGRTLLSARSQGKASEIAGIDIIPPTESTGLLDRYIQGDIDTLEIPYPEGYFDILICADLLEHLVDPWRVLKRLSTLLKPGGQIVASIPNARNYLLFVQIFIMGRFEYKQEGLFDRGHIRFFCKRDINLLVEGAGFEVQSYHFRFEKLRKFAWLLSVGLLEQFLVKQYLVVAKKV